MQNINRSAVEKRVRFIELCIGSVLINIWTSLFWYLSHIFEKASNKRQCLQMYISSWTRGLNVGLHSDFPYMSSKGSGESVHLRRLARDLAAHRYAR